MALGGLIIYVPKTHMKRRPYIYIAVPLFVILSCAGVLESLFGTSVLVVSSALIVVAWGTVWLRMYRHRGHPELAVLTILPFAAYYIVHQTGSPVFSLYPVCANFYALAWLAFAGVSIQSVLPDADTDGNVPTLRKDPVFLLMVPLILLFSCSCFLNFYSALTSS